MPLTEHPGTVHVHDVVLTLRPAEPMTEDAVENLTFEVERILYEHACGEQFSAAVACSFDPPGVEIDLSIPTVSASLLNSRLSMIIEELEKRLSTLLTLHEQKVEEAA